MMTEKVQKSGLVIKEQSFSIKGRARNLPCPCGSGKKAKRCHGR